MDLALILGKQLLSMFIMIAVGYLLVKLGLLRPSDSKPLSILIIYVISPCVVFSSFQQQLQPEILKEKFADQVSFCGGVDTQELLPNGPTEQVRAKVKELRTIFPTGLIISPSHEALQSDVPPKNVKAMFDEANLVY